MYSRDFVFVNLRRQVLNSRGQMDVQQEYASRRAGKAIYWAKMSQYVVPSKLRVISLIALPRTVGALHVLILERLCGTSKPHSVSR